MDFKSLLAQLDQLNEAETKTTDTGRIHKGDYGTSHGKEDVRDQYGHKIGKVNKDVQAKKEEPKKGRGRPTKASQASGEDKKYDFTALSGDKKDVKLKPYDKKKTTKHSIKEYIDQLESALNEAEQIQIKPANQMPKAPGQIAGKTSVPGQPQGVQSQPQKNTQVIAQGNKTLGTVDNPQLAQQIKQSIGKGEMTLNPDQQMKEGSGYDGSEPLNLSKNPSVNDVFKRALYIYDYEGYGNDMDYSEDDAIDQYVAQKFGQDVLNKLNNARNQSYFGRDDGKGPSGGGRTSNLGISSALGGKFRTTKAGVMNKQDAKTMKNKVADRLGRHPAPNLPEGDIGKHNNATTGFDALVKKLTPKYGVEAAKRIAGSQMKKIKEADIPPHDSLASPLSMEESKMPMKKINGKSVPAFAADGKGKNDLKNKKMEEAKDSASKTDKSKMPSMAHIKKMCQDGKSVAEICKMHPNCDHKELKQMVADCKKKMVKEGMNENLLAARLKGKHDGIKGHSHCGKTYEDMEEARCYHEGYKEGLDECYGQMPIQGYVGETNPPATLPGMADQAMREPAMEDDMYEMDKTSYMKQQAIKTPGDTFKAFGQTFKDKEVLESPFAFEAWDKKLNALLESKADVAEGMTVSISKGQQGAPDSVSVSAQDGEADQLLGIIKSAGLGLFGGDDQNGYGAPQGSTQAPGGIEVVDDHDGMMALMKKLTGQGGDEGSSADYADEEGSEEGHEGHEHTDEEACNECGMAYESCGCDHKDKEMVDEVESEDQMTYNVAEDNPPDSGAADTDAEIADTQQANASAASYDEAESEEEAASDQTVAEDEEEQVEESFANGDDDTFESDIDFMTNVISGGLNKRKATGQTTIPVVSTQVNRLGNPMRESTDLLHDWKKLSGIK
jgi:hypothetical protein